MVMVEDARVALESSEAKKLLDGVKRHEATVRDEIRVKKNLPSLKLRRFF